MSEVVESIRYTADISDVQNKLDRLARSNDSLGGRFSSASSKITGSLGKVAGGLGRAGLALGKFGAFGAVAAGGLAVSLAPEVLRMGASLDALEQKASTVFSGGALSKVQGWAEKTAGSLGVTTSEAVAMAASVGDLLKPMGFTADQAAAMSTQLSDLSGALSAWTGGTMQAAEVNDVLTKALLGERDGLKALGISISEADVQRRLAEKGQKDLTGAALEQAKALATQELIFEKSADAQKAWSDGSMDAVKSQNKMSAGMATLKETLIRAVYPAFAKLVPIVTKVTNWLASKMPGAIAVVQRWFDSNLQPTFDRLGAWFKKNMPEIQRIVGVAFGHVGRIAGWLGDKILRPLGQAFGEVVGWVQRNWPTISAVVQFVARRIGDYMNFLYGTVLPRLVDGVTAAVNGISWAWTNLLYPTLVKLGVWFRSAWQRARPVVKAIGDGIRTWARLVRSYFNNIVRPAFNLLRGIVSRAWSVAKPVLAGMKLYIETMFKIVRGYFNNVLRPAFNLMKGIFQGAWRVARPVIDTIKSTIRTAFRAVDTAFNEVLKPAFNGMKGIFEGAWNVASPVISTITSTISGMVATIRGAFDGVKQAIRDGWNWIANTWNSTIGATSFRTPDWIPGVGGKGFDMPNLPTLHNGGTVPGLPGEEVVMKLVAGETVRTRAQESRMAGGGEVHHHTHVHVDKVYGAVDRKFIQMVNQGLGQLAMEN